MKTERPPGWSDEEWRTVQCSEAQRILRECDRDAVGREPIGNANMSTMLVLFRLWLIGTKGTTKRGREFIRR